MISSSLEIKLLTDLLFYTDYLSDNEQFKQPASNKYCSPDWVVSVESGGKADMTSGFE